MVSRRPHLYVFTDISKYCESFLLDPVWGSLACNRETLSDCALIVADKMQKGGQFHMY